MSLAEGNAVVSAAGAQGLALRSNVVGADEDDAQSIAAQATTVGAAGMQGITLQNTVLRVGEAETQSIAQPVAGVNAAGIDDVRTMMQQILQSVGVTQQAVKGKFCFCKNNKRTIDRDSEAAERAAAATAGNEGIAAQGASSSGAACPEQQR